MKDSQSPPRMPSNGQPEAEPSAAEGWRRQYFEQLGVADRLEDRAREAEEALHSPRTAVMRAAWALCDDTEGTVHTDEFGEHYRVPKAQWDALAAALADVDPSEPSTIQKLRSELSEANGARRTAEASAQRLYEENGSDPHMLGALLTLVAMWESDDWVACQDEMAALARAAIAKATGKEPS